MKIALYFAEREPIAMELLAEAILAIKFEKWERAKEILQEVLEIVESNIENKEVQEVVA